MTRSPSVTGDAEQNGFVPCVGSFSFVVTPASQSCLPSARFRHRSVRRLATGWVRKMRSPQTMGVELPGSGSGMRQRTFSVLLQFKGRFFSVEMPSAFAPRQAGQLAAQAGRAAVSKTAEKEREARRS